MSRLSVFTAILVAVLLTASPIRAQQARNDPAELEAIQETTNSIVVAFNEGDAKAIAAYWTRSADFVGPLGEVDKGRGEIERSHAEFFTDNPGIKLKLKTTSRRFLRRNLVIEDGTYGLSNVSEKGVPPKGRFTDIWVKQRGRWRIAATRLMVPVAQPEN